jgi:para-aminobenzoate synthetase component 1
MSLLKHTLPYQADTTKLFAKVCHQPWAILLDSGQPHSQYGRYDILVADPFMTISTLEYEAGVNVTDKGKTGVYTRIQQGAQITISHDDPFAILNTALAPYLVIENSVAHNQFPFTGGAVGYFGYDLARGIEDLPDIAKKDGKIPSMLIGLYDWAVITDHRERTTYLVSNGFHQSTHERWPELCQLFSQQSTSDTTEDAFTLTTPVTSNMDFGQYAQAFEAVKRYITEGDCYQVNLAQRFSAQAKGNSWHAYLKLREISPAPFMAYMNFGELQVLSGSPERFLQVVGNHVETRPIKGTRPRSDDVMQDQQYAHDLQNSIKDRAENLMIVDLLRNDISKNCEIGSVKADTLFQLQSFANVHHLVSFITGTLKKGRTAIDLLKGCFPGGSITGAPKLRAMQIIEELEPHRRGVYCGAIGYIGFDGNMDTNIAIRTAVYSSPNTQTTEISFYAGGGIVADSQLEKEYAETLDKASSMLKTMQYFSRL